MKYMMIFFPHYLGLIMQVHTQGTSQELVGPYRALRAQLNR